MKEKENISSKSINQAKKMASNGCCEATEAVL
jgi:hypothetical protein